MMNIIRSKIGIFINNKCICYKRKHFLTDPYVHRFTGVDSHGFIQTKNVEIIVKKKGIHEYTFIFITIRERY